MDVNAEVSEGATRVALPGFGLNLDWWPEGADIFPTVLNLPGVMWGECGSLPFTTLREFTMMHLMDRISDKPDWEQKIFDKRIVLKWKEEALASKDMDISEAMVDWCIEELRCKTKILEETKAISVYDADVVKSDTIIPESLKLALRAAVASLEDAVAGQTRKGWRPGSDNQILDLVDPSLFPLVYGRTRILPNALTNLNDCVKRCGEGEVSIIPTLGCPSDNSYSKRFQWLPCDVDISSGSAKITSYINNLHPQEHRGLYRIIEEIISCSIPLWNMTLSPCDPWYRRQRITDNRCEYDPEGPQRGKFESDYDYDRRWEEWIRKGYVRVVVQPEPEAFQPKYWESKSLESKYIQKDASLTPEWRVDLHNDFREEGFQVIVKLASIHLTPENPKYLGESWHVEGRLNEYICAVALYHYDNYNITPSHLAFRQHSDIFGLHPQCVKNQQEHHDWLQEVFGCNKAGPVIQHVGAVETKEGRLVTFPNNLHQKVQPFELADPSKPGHRKILALFLVGPNIKIISTANVPCQRRDWWRECIGTNGNALGRLPVELQDLVFDLVDPLDFPPNFEEAASLRSELMEERKRCIDDIISAFN